MPRSNLLGYHTNNNTPLSNSSVSKMRNSRIYKTLVPDHGVLTTVRQNNPDCYVLVRRYFGDDRIDNVAERSASLIEYIRDYKGLVNGVELPWNESHQTRGQGISAYADASVESYHRIKDALPWVEVWGGGFSEGNPPDESDWEAWDKALAVVDGIHLHEYNWPNLYPGQDGKSMTENGQRVGWHTFRYRRLRHWLEATGRRLVPFILSEYGLDHGVAVSGQQDGWRRLGVNGGQLADMLRGQAQEFAVDLDYLIGVLIYCCGVNDPHWHNFNVAGVPEIEALMNEEIIPAHDPEQRHQATKHAWHPQYVKNAASPVTEFSEWQSNPENKHTPGTLEYLQAFIANREANSGVASGSFGDRDALAGGFPPDMLNDIRSDHSTSHGDPYRGIAHRLGVSVSRIHAIRSVESNGTPFGSKDRALIRFELSRFLERLTTEELHYADHYFRILPGMPDWSDEAQEVVDRKGDWQKLQKGNQSFRWLALTIAAGISREKAFITTAMGEFQIMGWNHFALGYKTAEEMIRDFNTSESAQLLGAERMIKSNPRMLAAIISGDAESFAAEWNGRGQIRLYADRLRKNGW